MSMSEMAKMAVEERIAAGIEKYGKEEFEFDIFCYQSALDAFQSLMDDGHSGSSIHVTKGIFNRLIDGLPLAPIEDIPENWELIRETVGLSNDGCQKIWQCTKMSGLFKTEWDDGEVSFSDINRTVYYDLGDLVNGRVSGYNWGFTSDFMDDIYPVTMPYMPVEAVRFRVYGRKNRFLQDTEEGEFDTLSLLYFTDREAERSLSFLQRQSKEYPIPIEKYFFLVDNDILANVSKEEFELRRRNFLIAEGVWPNNLEVEEDE